LRNGTHSLGLFTKLSATECIEILAGCVISLKLSTLIVSVFWWIQEQAFLFFCDFPQFGPE
jgi:hypothetical protein